MDAEEIGNVLGQLVLEMTAREFPEVNELIDRHSDSTILNLAVAFAWVAATRSYTRFSEETADAVVNSMLDAMKPSLMEWFAWERDDIERLIWNRFEGYDAAIGEGRDQGVPSVAQYFMASCQDMRIDLPYDNIIPDLDELELMKDELNLEVFSELKQQAATRNPSTYSMKPLLIAQVATTIFGVAEGVDEILDKI
ncbi:MAG: hypothetical protein KAV00_02290 [Phycisphaerae bacterium]|nr:hypothetical protein [Phycisphaerae bacterium]